MASARLAYSVTLVVCVVVIHASVPVLIALLTPLIIYAIFVHYRLLHN